MKKSFFPLIMLLAFLNIAWLGGWASWRLIQNLIVSGKFYTTQTTAPKNQTSQQLTTCGGTPDAVVTTGSTDIAGSITLGGTAVTACKVTFDSVWTSAPICVVSATGPTTVVATTDTTGIFMSAASAITTYKVNWHCIGNQ